MKPARRTSSEVSRLQRNISYAERQPLLRTLVNNNNNNSANNNSTANNNQNTTNALSRSIEKGLSLETKITADLLVVPKIGRKGHLSESSDSCDNVTLPLTHSQKWILLCLCLVDFTAFASMSIIAPFFPLEASLRGQSTYIAGLVFSTYSLTVVIASVFFGPLSAHIGPKFMLLAGIAIAGTANIIFGLLDFINNDTTFIALCFIIRIIEALGAASFNTASLVYVFEVFPDHVGYAFSMTETFTTLGTTLGPAIGGLLYSWGGYSLPFYVLGVFSFITIPLCASKLPRISKARRNMTSSASYWQLLKIPKIAMICLIVLVLAQSMSFLDPTLEPFYRSLGYDVNIASLAFFIMSGTVCIFLPLFSKLVERVENEFLCMFIGLTINAVGLIILGPSDFLNINPTLGLSLASMVIIALGYALAFIPTFENILSIAMDHGMEDNLATYGTVSGLWSTMFALGEATGPILGGSLTDVVTFSMVSSFMALFSIVMAIVAGIAMTVRSNRKY